MMDCWIEGRRISATGWENVEATARAPKKATKMARRLNRVRISPRFAPRQAKNAKARKMAMSMM